jgi:hypothetical protein
MVQEDAKPTRTIGSHPASGNDAGKGDRLAVLLLQGQQAGPVALGILAGQIADLEALDPDGHGVGVIGVVRLGSQDRERVFAHPAIWAATSPDDAPGEPWSTLVHTPSEPSGSQRSPAVRDEIPRFMASLRRQSPPRPCSLAVNGSVRTR